MKLQRVYFTNKSVVTNLKEIFKMTLNDPKYIKVSQLLSEKLEEVKKNPYLNQQKESMYKKIVNINSWYTKTIGLDELKLFQDRVILLQEKLLSTQEKRREIGAQLNDVRKKINQLQDGLQKVKRQQDPETYFNLMKEETEALKLEQEINTSFQEYDRTERDLFSAFSNAVRDSHEKQRAQVEYTKYFGIILSITGSFLAFCYSTMRKRDIKKLITEQLQLQTTISSPKVMGILENQHRVLADIKNNQNIQIRSILQNQDRILADIIKNLNNQNKKLVNDIKHDNNNRFDSEAFQVNENSQENLINAFVIIAGVGIFVGFILGKIV